MLKEAPPSEHLFPARFPSSVSTHSCFPQRFNHYKRCPVQVESQGHRVQARRTSNLIRFFGIMLTRIAQLVNTDTKAVVVESHRRITGGGNFLKAKTPRYMNLDIADEVVEFSELILLTFLLVWKERVGARAKSSELRGTASDFASTVLMSSR